MFVKVFDDLGTPLVMGVTNMLAPQAYLRITSIGIEDPLGYVISVIMIVLSILALWMASRVMKGKVVRCNAATCAAGPRCWPTRGWGSCCW